MGQCKSNRARPSFAPRAAVTVLATTLFACAQIAGLEEPTDERVTAPSRGTDPTKADPTKDEGGLSGGEKGNTDADNAGQLDVPLAKDGIDFSNVDCNTVATKNLTIFNKGKEALDYAIILPETLAEDQDRVFNIIDKQSGKIPANGNVTVEVSAFTRIAGQIKGNILVTAGASYVTVPVGVNGKGPTLEWGSTTADIGETRTNTEGTTRVKLRNTGTDKAEISGFTTAGTNAGDFKVLGGGFTIPVDGEREVDLALITGGAASSSVLTANIKPTAPHLCAPAPAITVTGKRISTDVIVTGADWGKRECYSTPSETKSVTIKNYFNKPITWSLSPTAKFLLQTASAATGTVPAATGATPQTATIVFKAPALEGPTPLSEPLAVTIAGDGLPTPGNGTHNIALKVDVRGAMVELVPVPATLSFTAAQGKSDAKTYQIKNTGNEPAWIAWKFARTAGVAAWTDLPQETYTEPARTTNEQVRYQPTGDPPEGGANTATLTPSRRGNTKKICNELAALQVVNLSGQKP